MFELKSLYHAIRIHKQKAEHLSVQMKKPFAKFLDAKDEIEVEVSEGEAGIKNKKYTYRQKLNKKMISVDGVYLKLGEAIYLLMLTKREEGHRLVSFWL